MNQQNNLNFKVFQASAGSGKTYTIVKEYLKLCLASASSVDHFRHILAITFTNASANDMKRKILDHLNDIIDSVAVKPKTMEADLMAELNISDADLKHNAAMLRTRIIHDYSSFCVSTIDSFVQKLARTFARDLNLPSQYTVSIDEDDIAATIVDNLAMRISSSNPLLVESLSRFSEEQFSKEGAVMPQTVLSDFVNKLMAEKAFQRDGANNIKDLSQYKQTLAFLNQKLASFEKLVKTFLVDFAALEKKYGTALEDYSKGATGFISFINKLRKREFVHPSKAFLEVASNGEKWVSTKGKKRLSNSEIQQIGDEMSRLFTSVITDYESGLADFLFYGSQRDLLYLYALREQIREEFDRLRDDDEVVPISEFNKLLNRMMGDFSVPFVYERIGEYFRHIFVDEFQDTSVLQWQNLLPLIDNGLAANEMSMVVGDGKQSIYRFRSGEVEQIVQLPEIYALPTDDRHDAFVQYQKNLVANFSFTNLGSNYRSFANVVNFNNDFFEATVANETSSNLKKVYKDENETFKKKVAIKQKVEKKEEGLVQVELYDAVSQPDYCCERIEELINELQGKGYGLSDITILVRHYKVGAKVANYLNGKGIPVISQDSILLKYSDKVQLLVNTLSHFINDSDAVVIANILFFNQLVNNSDFKGDAGSLFDAAMPVAQKAVTLESVMGLPSDAFADAFSKATCLYDLCASLTRIYGIDTLQDAYLNYFMEEVSSFQSAQKESIKDFLSFWELKKDKLAVKMKATDAVQVMTIHKSKGLEFNVVIYPEAIIDLDEKLNNTPAEEWVSPSDLGFNPIPNLDKVLLRLSNEAQIIGGEVGARYEKEKESVRLDNLNLLYVAFTRAKQRLYVLAKQADAKKPNILRDFLADKETNKVEDATVREGALMYRFGDADSVKPDQPQPKPSPTHSLSSRSVDWMSKISLDASPTMFWSSDEDKMSPIEWGEKVHSILSKIRTVNDIDDAILPSLLDGTLDAKMAELLKAKFMQMTEHPLIAEAFGESAIVKNECDILFKGNIKRPDRYAELPDVIYLIDYKTGKPSNKHHEQLLTYASALKELTDKEIRAFLVYLSEDTIAVERV